MKLLAMKINDDGTSGDVVGTAEFVEGRIVLTGYMEVFRDYRVQIPPKDNYDWDEVWRTSADGELFLRALHDYAFTGTNGIGTMWEGED